MVWAQISLFISKYLCYVTSWHDVLDICFHTRHKQQSPGWKSCACLIRSSTPFSSIYALVLRLTSSFAAVIISTATGGRHTTNPSLQWTWHELYERRASATHPLFSLTNNTCCWTGSCLSSFSLLVHGCSWLNPHLWWYYMRGDDKEGAVSLSRFEIYKSQVCRFQIGFLKPA